MSDDRDATTAETEPPSSDPARSAEPSEAPAEPSSPDDSSDAEPVQADSGEPKKKGFGWAYWMLNNIEAFERLAYFGVRAVVPIYIMQATEPGGLHLTAIHKGWIYMWWAIFQSFLPIVTGGYADRYGYKRVLGFAITANAVGYVMMAFMTSYYGFFAGILVLATGTAFFKPSLQGSLAQSLNKDNSSVGWGIFYWVVNIGAFVAPLLSTLILGKPHSAEGWRNLFLASAGYTIICLLLLLTFKDVPSGASKTEGAIQVMTRTLRNILDARLLVWLAIMSCFWLMMYQLWDLHPNFIEDWVDSSMIAAIVPFDSWREYGDMGVLRVPQQLLINLNPALIILLILPLSWLVRRMRTLSAMVIGMSVATAGILVSGLTGNGWFLLLGIVFFSSGEMLTGPKKNEYLGLIAPEGKKAMYLGYVNIPVGVGVGIGSLIAGYVYDHYGEKASLAMRHLGAHHELIARAAQSSDWSDTFDKVPALARMERSAALGRACEALGESDEGCAKALIRLYRHDRGQIANLALQHLALHPDFRDEVNDQTDWEPLTEQTVARWATKLSKFTGVNRSEALERVRYLSTEEQGGAELEHAAIVETLWTELGSQPENLTNLALEYLAQATPLVSEALASLDFADPVATLESDLGLGRTKSFAALSVARGWSHEKVDAHMEQHFGEVESPSDRVYAYLIQLPHLRFKAVARKDWARDVALLETLVSSDPEALQAAQARLGGGPGPLDYQALAEEQDAIQAALDHKRWSAAPEQAAMLLGLNPFEAQAVAASELAQARKSTTKLLWETYHPQYKVWIPFAIIGVLATIALWIFGRMAKRWKDMNA